VKRLFATTGHGDVKALNGALKGRYRLRVASGAPFSVSIRQAA